MRPWQWQRAFTVHSHFEPHQKQNDRSTSIQSISSANAIREIRKRIEIMEWNSSRVCWGCIWPTVGSIEECFCWKINSFQFLDSCNAHRCVDFAKPILQLQPNWQDCNILDFFICNPIHLFEQPRFENDKWVFQNPPCPLLHRIRYAKTNRQRTDWEALRGWDKFLHTRRTSRAMIFCVCSMSLMMFCKYT